jgi:glutamine cyclotransferase
MYQWLLLIIFLNVSASTSADNVSINSLPNFILTDAYKINAKPRISQTSTESLQYLSAVSTISSVATSSSQKTSAKFPVALKPNVLAQEPYNQQWFTQGFFKDDETFYISSGLYNKSVLVYQSPHKNLRYFLPPQYFAEGLTVIDDKLFLLTWKEETLFIFDKKTLTPISKLTYKGEGWGLTHNENSFIMSNGSNNITFRDKNSFEVQHALTIQNFDNINELEYIDGIIWANRWYDEKIYAIDSKNGCILASIDLTNLRLDSITSNDKNITNGIAYDKERDGLWVTGKYWNQRFLIALPQLDKSVCM